jgi:hypothetical protein
MLVQAGQVKSAAPMQHGLSGDSVRVTEGSGHLSRIHQANAAMPSEVLGGVHWALARALSSRPSSRGDPVRPC